MSKDLDVENILDYLSGPNAIPRVFIGEKVKGREGKVMTGAEEEREKDLKMLHAGFEQEPRSTVDLQKLAKEKETDSLGASKRNQLC